MAAGRERSEPAEHPCSAPAPSRDRYREEMTREQRLRVALALNIVIVVIQVVAGLAAHSLGLIADAGHNLTDVAAVIVSLIAVRLAVRPATARRSFGYHRSTILAAQANAAGILVVSAIIVFEAVSRLRAPEPVDGPLVIVIAGIGLAGNTIAALFLRERGPSDLNMRSAMLHMVGDAAASAGVLLAGIVLTVRPSLEWVDPAVSIAISIVLAWRAVGLLGETAEVLLESTPAGIDTVELVAAMAAVDGVESVHDLHVWSLSSELRALAAHLVLEGHPTLEQAQVVGDRVKVALATGYAIGHATLELECEACATEGDPCLDAVAIPTAGAHSHAGHHH